MPSSPVRRITGLLTIGVASALAQTPLPLPSAAPTLAPFSAAAPGAPPAPWRVVGLPGNKVPLARVEISPVDGAPVLSLATDKSYGSAVHDLPRITPGAATVLRWRWKLASPLVGADLRTKAGDDAALKVCALFDMPLDGLALTERTLIRFARSVSGEPLPSASLCYVWDATLPAGTLLPNAFSARVRYLVVNGAETVPGRWVNHERRLEQDFRLAFGQEASSVPPLIAIAVGADADNTGGKSLGHVGDVTLTP